MSDVISMAWPGWKPPVAAGEGPRLPSEEAHVRVGCSPGVVEVLDRFDGSSDAAVAGSGGTALAARVMTAVSQAATTAASAASAVAATVMNTGLDDQTFEELVQAHYEALYRFAFSLAQSESDARDLVQETYAQLARKGGQIKSVSKAKSWLFTTLYRSFVDGRRRDVRHPKVEIEAAEMELPVMESEVETRLDAATVQAALMRIEEVFRVPLVLFYLEDHSYLEIAEILNIPAGTVMSRISRGRALLRRQFEEPKARSVAASEATSAAAPMPAAVETVTGGLGMKAGGGVS